jgi:hypothetical protein
VAVTTRLVPLNLLAVASAPTTSKLGDLYLNTSNNTVYVWTGSVWTAVGSGGSADGASIASYSPFDGGGPADDTIFDADITKYMTDTLDLGTP